ncbi:unnamed protein product [Candidula unifasciata]|uniref:Sodium-coupled monocarboxylate transporter 1 n=1 Tax=Candidula unifasciata TaxID=100452 RepID=A0A8S3ZCS1_9EUPU|nr:unnamed protein product [Candidula unifasciata]
MDTSVSLQAIDYIVLAVILLVSLGIGVLFAVKDFKNATRIEYLLGGRRMFMLPVALSIFATFTSGISLIGIPTDFYLYGAMANLINVGMAMSCLYVMLLFVPLLYPLHLMSLYEYLHLRFESRAVRLLAVVLAMLQTIGYMSVTLLSPALAMQASVGLPLWLSIGVIGLIGALYTAIGGIKSVVWTDVFQCLVTLGGVLTIIIKGFSVVGGGHAVFKIVQENGRASFTEMSFDPRVKFTWWGTTFGFSIYWFSTICSQSSLQRISGMRSMTAAKQAFLMNSVLFIVYGAMLTAMSWVTFAYFVHIRCDPFEAAIVSNKNQLPPYFVMRALRDVPAIGGIYMAMIFSSSLSTVSSGINALAANTVEDFLKRRLHKLQESTATLITKVLVFLYGILIIVFAYGANSLQGSVTQIMISNTGGWGGVVVGMFLLGALIPWANKYGAISGAVLALIVSMWITLGSYISGPKSIVLPSPPTDMCFQNRSLTEFATNFSSQSYSGTTTTFSSQTRQLSNLTSYQEKSPSDDGFFMYDISHLWFSAISSTITFVVGIAVSYCTRKYCASVTDQKYLFVAIRKLWFPEKTNVTQELNSDEMAVMI